MNKKFLQIILVFALVLLSFTEGFSQFKRRKGPFNKYHSHHLMYLNNIRATGFLGLSSYYGDLCDNFICYRYRPGLTVGSYYRYSAKVSFRGDLTYLRLNGNDARGDNAKRNASFRSSNVELAAGVMYDILPFERNYHLRAQYMPYVFIELGLLYFNPRAQYNGKWYSLRPLMTEGKKYHSLTLAVPFGGGVRYKINSYMDLSFELAYRKTFSDYLDDVSTVYKDNSSFSDPIAAALADRTTEGGYLINYDTPDGNHWDAGHKRGNPKKKDGYFMFGFKFEYMIKTTQQTHSINSMPRFRHKHSGMHRKYR